MQAKDILNKRGYMLRLTTPIFFVYLLNMAVNLIDQIMVGNYSQTAVSAVGNANQISWVMTMFFSVLNVASIILITQFKGAGNGEKEKVLYVLTLLCNIVSSVVVGFVCITFGRQIFTGMNVQGEAVIADACSYLSITGGSIFFMAIMLTYSSFLKSNSIMTWPLVSTIIMNLFNILGNWVLIYGVGPFPELGTTGAAISTAGSRVVGAILLSIVFRVKIGKLQWKRLRPFPLAELRRMLKIGLPSAGENISYNIAQLVVMMFINTMGITQVNTKIYVNTVASFTYIFTFALAEATQVVEGYMIGDRKISEANRRVMRSLVIALCSSVTLSAMLFLFSDNILGLFMATSNDADIALLRGEILQLAHWVLMIDIVLELGRACNVVMVKALQTAGDVVFPVVSSIISSWCITVALSYVFGIVCDLGVIGVWLAFCCDECLRGSILVIRWKRGRWRKIDLIADVREQSPAAQ